MVYFAGVLRLLFGPKHTKIYHIEKKAKEQYMQPLNDYNRRNIPPVEVQSYLASMAQTLRDALPQGSKHIFYKQCASSENIARAFLNKGIAKSEQTASDCYYATINTVNSDRDLKKRICMFDNPIRAFLDPPLSYDEFKEQIQISMECKSTAPNNISPSNNTSATRDSDSLPSSVDTNALTEGTSSTPEVPPMNNAIVVLPPGDILMPTARDVLNYILDYVMAHRVLCILGMVVWIIILLILNGFSCSVYQNGLIIGLAVVALPCGASITALTELLFERYEFEYTGGCWLFFTFLFYLLWLFWFGSVNFGVWYAIWVFAVGALILPVYHFCNAKHKTQ